jgi:hypothetical protein
MRLQTHAVNPTIIALVAALSFSASTDVLAQRRGKAAAAPTSVHGASGWHLTLGPEEPLQIGRIHNAPNGHLSYRMAGGQLTLWVDGRVPGTSPQTSTQGTFILHPKSWNTADLESASPLKVLEAPHNRDECDAPDGFYRDYAAINAIIPGTKPGELLAFLDGEFHPDKYSTDPAKLAKPSIPLLAAIGLATSTDGVTWAVQGAVVRGLDVANHRTTGDGTGCKAVVSTMTAKLDLEGAAGPSAVIRTDNGSQYIYLYYEDRVRLSAVDDAGVAPKSGERGRGRGHASTRMKPTADLYVARSPYASDGAPGSWQFWTGSGWKEPPSAVPIVKAPDGGEAAHPQVSFNTALKRWLMVFHTQTDLYATTSADGLKWDPPVPLNATNGTTKTPSFPTLISPDQPDQQTTTATGALYYSAHATGEYLGFTRTFAVSK